MTKAETRIIDNSFSTTIPTNGEDYFPYDEEIELVVQGREILVKESLLSRHSKYFYKVFGGLNPEEDMVVLKHGLLDGGGGGGINGHVVSEDEEDSCSDEIEPLTLISYQTMKSIIDFLHTGAIKIGEVNVKSLLLAADLLVIESVERECFKFLKSNLNVQNCVRHFVLAATKPRNWSRLSRKMLRFIQLHFSQVARLTQLYQLTDVDQFKSIIRDENLCVQKEEEVLDAIKEWVDYDWDNRHQYLVELLDEVQWPLIREEKHLLYALHDPTFSSDEKALETLMDAIQYHRMTHEEKVKFWDQKKKPSRWPKLLAALSYADKKVECFDFAKQSWSVLTIKPGANFGPEMCYLNGMLYILGGVQAKQVCQFDLEKGKWAEDFPDLKQFRVAHGVVANAEDDTIYVMGGSAKASADFGPGLDEMEILKIGIDNEIKQQWSMVSPMDIGRSYLATALGDNKVYVVAGCLTENTSTAEVYDIGADKWSNIADTATKRDSLGLVCFDDVVYAIGGFNNIENKYLRTVECFDPAKNAWNDLKPMSVARRSPGVVVHQAKIYVVGGMGEKEDLSSVEVYDMLNDHWIKFPHPMTEICGWTTCCLVEKPLRMIEADRIESESKDVLMFNGKVISSAGQTEQNSRNAAKRKTSLIASSSNFSRQNSAEIQRPKTKRRSQSVLGERK